MVSIYDKKEETIFGIPAIAIGFLVGFIGIALDSDVLMIIGSAWIGAVILLKAFGR